MRLIRENKDARKTAVATKKRETRAREKELPKKIPIGFKKHFQEYTILV